MVKLKTSRLAVPLHVTKHWVVKVMTQDGCEYLFSFPMATFKKEWISMMVKWPTAVHITKLSDQQHEACTILHLDTTEVWMFYHPTQDSAWTDNSRSWHDDSERRNMFAPWRTHNTQLMDRLVFRRILLPSPPSKRYDKSIVCLHGIWLRSFNSSSFKWARFFSL